VTGGGLLFGNFSLAVFPCNVLLRGKASGKPGARENESAISDYFEFFPATNPAIERVKTSISLNFGVFSI
jgi:hypothetical protein